MSDSDTEGSVDNYEGDLSVFQHGGSFLESVDKMCVLEYALCAIDIHLADPKRLGKTPARNASRSGRTMKMKLGLKRPRDFQRGMSR